MESPGFFCCSGRFFGGVGVDVLLLRLRIVRRLAFGCTQWPSLTLTFTDGLDSSWVCWLLGKWLAWLFMRSPALDCEVGLFGSVSLGFCTIYSQVSGPTHLL